MRIPRNRKHQTVLRWNIAWDALRYRGGNHNIIWSRSRIIYCIIDWRKVCTGTKFRMVQSLCWRIICPQEKLMMDYLIFTYFHPKYLGLEATLRHMPENVNDKLKSVTRIVLTFSVQSHIESKYNLTYIDNT